MKIGDVIEEMEQNGRMCCRAGWNGKGMWIALHVPAEDEEMTMPYVYMKTADNHRVPWLCSQTDLLADDWMVL